MKFVRDLANCSDLTESVLKSEGGTFLGRVGGSDTDCVAYYLEYLAGLQSNLDGFYGDRLAHVRDYNGYYDLQNSRVTFDNFVKLMLECYDALRVTTFGGPKLASLYFPESMNPKFLKKDAPMQAGLKLLVERMQSVEDAETQCMPYAFIERFLVGGQTLFKVFERLLVGKRILVVSPFAESIELNFSKRHKFIKDYDYPDFLLSVYNTPITYAGLPERFYPHADWFETVEAMTSDLRKFDFDIALLSCGSYSMPIGRFIESEMKKKAVYVGGVLQLYFGILGRRYEGEYYARQLNIEEFIRPLEARQFLEGLPENKRELKEAFGAYF